MKDFAHLLEDLRENKLESIVETLKPIQFRDYVVRFVCSSTGEAGERLRKLWIKMYKGDLRYGVRDARREAKESNWPLRMHSPGRKDRTSWIVFALKKTCVAAQKIDNKNK